MILEQVQRAYLRVYQFVAELREEELRVLLPHVVEIFADLGIQPNAYVIVDSELTMFLTVYCHLPAIQHLVFAESVILA